MDLVPLLILTPEGGCIVAFFLAELFLTLQTEMSVLVLLGPVVLFLQLCILSAGLVIARVLC